MIVLAKTISLAVRGVGIAFDLDNNPDCFSQNNFISSALARSPNLGLSIGRRLDSRSHCRTAKLLCNVRATITIIAIVS